MDLYFPNVGLEKAFRSEDFNGFGFQTTGLSEKGTLVIGRLSENAPSDLQTDLRQTTSSKTVRVIDFLSTEFVTIHFSEWELIPDIFSRCSALCSWIAPEIHNLKPTRGFKGGCRFSFEWAEKTAVQEFRNLVDTLKPPHVQNNWKFVYELLGKPRPMRMLYNWRTLDGRLFCVELNTHLGKAINARTVAIDPPWYSFDDVDESCKEHKVLHYGGWSKRELQHIKPDEPQAKRQKSDDNDETVCVVCLDKLANTLALPCGHVVVCKDCSATLSETQFASKCVYCRQHIDTVLTDEP